MEKLKWLIENTNLFIYVCGTNPNIVSDFGKAESIDLERQVVMFDRSAEIRHRFGGPSEFSAMANAFLSNEINLSEAKFSLDVNKSKVNTDWSPEGWHKYNMDNFNGNSWDELYRHVKINFNWWSKLLFKCGWKKTCL